MSANFSLVPDGQSEGESGVWSLESGAYRLRTHRSRLTAADSGLKTLDGSLIRADFGPRSRIAKRGISALCNALCASSQRADIVAKWQTTQALPDTARSLLEKERVTSFGKLASNATAKPDEVLLAVQTYFALVVKLIAASTVLGSLRPDEPGAWPFAPEL